jgi:hypothetical protein
VIINKIFITNILKTSIAGLFYFVTNSSISMKHPCVALVGGTAMGNKHAVIHQLHWATTI